MENGKSQSISSKLTKALDNFINDKYGTYNAPESLITPTGIRHLDAILGGGISSNLPVVLTSTPETGKSTFALQLASVFQKTRKSPIVIYLDTETSSNTNNNKTSRVENLGIDTNMFIYKPMLFNLSTAFEFFITLINNIKEVKEKTNENIDVLIIWDSISSTTSSKDASVEEVDQLVGFRARELSFLINKYKADFIMSQVTFLFIDQVRSNMKITNRFTPKDEKGVGDFGNVKSSTNVVAFQHAIHQWLYLSKGCTYNLSDPFGIDGWEINISTEKNKLAPSKLAVSVIFDKKSGVDPLLSEYLFLSEMTKTEKISCKNESGNLSYPLAVKVEGKSKIIEYMDDNNVKTTSDKFTERNFKKKYNSDQAFKKIFDDALEISIRKRIINEFINVNPREK